MGFRPVHLRDSGNAVRSCKDELSEIFGFLEGMGVWAGVVGGGGGGAYF